LLKKNIQNVIHVSTCANKHFCVTCNVRFLDDMLLCRMKLRTSRADEPLVSPRFATASSTRAISRGFDGRTILKFWDSQFTWWLLNYPCEFLMTKFQIILPHKE